MSNVSEAARTMGRRSAEVRVQRWGEREFTRRMGLCGKLGGWPKGRPRKKGGRARLPDHLVSKAALYQRARRARLKQQAVKTARKGSKKK